jgi:4-amino-4-deoxy-L-arabinose transferase-like glycosyltransferase
MTILETGHLYRTDYSTPPFHPAAYPPITHFILAPFVLLFGPAYWYGRILVFLATLGIAVLLFFIAKKQFGKQAALFASFIWLSSTYTLFWGALLRVDILGVFFSLAALWSALQTKKLKQLLLTIIFTLLALGTKQTFLLTLVPTITLFFFQESKKRALLYLATVLGLGILGLLLLNWYESGGFWYNVFVINKSMFYSGLGFLMWTLEFATRNIYLLLGVLVGAIYITITKKYKKIHFVFGLYFLLTLLNLVATSKSGANNNYFLEIVPALGLVIASLVVDSCSAVIQKTLVAIHLVWTVGTLLLFNLYPILTEQHYLLMKYRFSPDNNYIFEIIKNAPGEVLVDIDAGFLPIAGKRILLEPFVMKVMHFNNMWDQRPLVDMVNNQEFSLVIASICRESGILLSPPDDKITFKYFAEDNYCKWLTHDTYQSLANNYQFLEVAGSKVVLIPNNVANPYKTPPKNPILERSF